MMTPDCFRAGGGIRTADAETGGIGAHPRAEVAEVDANRREGTLGRYCHLRKGFRTDLFRIPAGGKSRSS